jgi:hypothetical protein
MTSFLGVDKEVSRKAARGYKLNNVEDLLAFWSQTNSADSTDDLLRRSEFFIKELKALKRILFVGTQNQKHLN